MESNWTTDTSKRSANKLPEVYRTIATELTTIKSIEPEKLEILKKGNQTNTKRL